MIFSIIGIAITILAIGYTALILKWIGKATMYRRLWIELGATWEARLEKMRRERNEHFTTAQWQAVALGEYKTRVALQKQELTKLYAGRDSMLNGDRICVAGHRYYTGQGISCPHCGAMESSLPMVHQIRWNEALWEQVEGRMNRRLGV